jgi:hypothetical protein
VGYNSGNVAMSYSSGSVAGGAMVGGLAGGNRSPGSVTQCYSTGLVSGDWGVGGFMGLNSAVVTACFWDTQTSGFTRTSWGTGKTTAEMQMAKTFLAAGWDFVGETANGTEDIWRILEGRDYPRLWWENAPQ